MERTWEQLSPHLPPGLAPFGLPAPQHSWLRVGRFDVHACRWACSGARRTVLLIHGGGANARLMAPFASLALACGMDAMAIDLPGYGATRARHGRAVDYEDWCEVAAGALTRLAGEGEVLVMGVSMGGLLGYEAVARTRTGHGLLATCLLQPRDPATRRQLVRWPWMARLAPAMLGAAPWLTDRLPVPMRLASNMPAISNQRAIAALICGDPQSGGCCMPAGFLRSYLDHQPSLPPERFDVCPVLLAHPGADRWTDPQLSRDWYDRLAVRKQWRVLEGCSHLPLEQPGFFALGDALGALCRGLEPPSQAGA